jgi:hypothetical protein
MLQSSYNGNATVLGLSFVYKVVDEADLVDKVKQLVSELKGDSDAGNNAWIYQYDAGLKAEAPIVAETYVVRAGLSGAFIGAGWLGHMVMRACAANKQHTSGFLMSLLASIWLAKWLPRANASLSANGFQVPVVFNGFVSEFDIDCLFADGECVYANVVDNWLPDAPYFQDKGFDCPTIVPPKVCANRIRVLMLKGSNWRNKVSGFLLAYCAKHVAWMGGDGLFAYIREFYWILFRTLRTACHRGKMQPVYMCRG